MVMPYVKSPVVSKIGKTQLEVSVLLPMVMPIVEYWVYGKMGMHNWKFSITLPMALTTAIDIWIGLGTLKSQLAAF